MAEPLRFGEIRLAAPQGILYALALDHLRSLARIEIEKSKLALQRQADPAIIRRDHAQ